MGKEIGAEAHALATKRNNARNNRSEIRTCNSSKEALLV